MIPISLYDDKESSYKPNFGQTPKLPTNYLQTIHEISTNYPRTIHTFFKDQRTTKEPFLRTHEVPKNFLKGPTNYPEIVFQEP